MRSFSVCVSVYVYPPVCVSVYAVYVQLRLLFTRRFSSSTLHVSAYRPSSDVQVVVMKESAAHCEATFFLLCGCLGLLLVMWVNHAF
jgi:hypothetical protein